MNAVTFEKLHELDQLQLRYMDALDQKCMGGWLNTFSHNGSYICKTLESEQANWKIALILDDCHGRLKDRVTFVDKIWAGTFQDYQTRHFVQRNECHLTDEGQYTMRSNFSVMFTRSDTGQTGILASGSYHDVIELWDGQPRFRSKKVVIDAPLLPHYIVYPL